MPSMVQFVCVVRWGHGLWAGSQEDPAVSVGIIHSCLTMLCTNLGQEEDDKQPANQPVDNRLLHLHHDHCGLWYQFSTHIFLRNGWLLTVFDSLWWKVYVDRPQLINHQPRRHNCRTIRQNCPLSVAQKSLQIVYGLFRLCIFLGVRDSRKLHSLYLGDFYIWWQVHTCDIFWWQVHTCDISWPI